MSDLMIKWRDPVSGQWRDYLGMDLLGLMTLEDVCHQFDGDLDVVAREGSRYIVSSDGLAASYAKKRADVTTFRALLAAGGDHLQQEFRRVGFFGLVGVGDVIC
jgi:hypothetical protein